LEDVLQIQKIYSQIFLIIMKRLLDTISVM
jgi:hypothetical protein